MEGNNTQKSQFKRNFLNAFDAISSYLQFKWGKPSRQRIRVYSTYSATTDAMGHSSIFNKGCKSMDYITHDFDNGYQYLSNRKSEFDRKWLEN